MTNEINFDNRKEGLKAGGTDTMSEASAREVGKKEFTEKSKRNYFKELYDLYESLFKLNMVKNEILIIPTFHCFLGIINPVCYISGGKYISTRIHPFMIQPSRSGKGIVMKMLFNLTKHMTMLAPEQVEFMDNKLPVLKPTNIRPFYTLKTTEAALLSQEIVVGRKTDLIPGLLKDRRLVCYDEGRELLSTQPAYENVRIAWNMAMDEDGNGGAWMSKALKTGIVEFYTHTTMLAGSVLTEEMKGKMLDEGFYQRCYLLFQTFTEEEIVEITKEIIKLTQVHKNQINEIVEKIVSVKEDWEKVVGKKYLKSNARVPYIMVDKDSVEKLREKIQSYWEEEIKETYTEGKQSQLMSFLVGNMIDKALKIATQKAVFELKDAVDEEDYNYAVEACKPNMESVKSLLATIKHIPIKTDRREEILYNVIKSAGKEGITTTVLFDHLRVLKNEGRWDTGRNGTLKLIKKLEAKNKVKTEFQALSEKGGKEKVFWAAEFG